MDQESPTDRIKTTFYLPAELHKRLRLRAAEEQTSMVDVLTRVLDQGLGLPTPVVAERQG